MSKGYAGESVGHTPPQDLQAGQSILGAMLISRDAISDMVEVLRDSDFYQSKHENIFESIISLYGRGEFANSITAAVGLDHTGDLQRVGGAVYLHDLLTTIPIATNTSYYVEITREKAILRRLVNVLIRIARPGYQGQSEVNRIVNEVQQTLLGVTGSRTNEDYQSFNDLMEPIPDEMEAIVNSGDVLSGVPTGFDELNSLTDGLHPGWMIIVVAHPGVGKSTFTLDICRAVAIHHNLATVFFSLEMSCTEIVMKILNTGALVPLQKIHGRRMDENDWQRIIDRSVTLSGEPLLIGDSLNLTTVEIRAKARHLRQRNNLQLICINHTQLVTSGRKVESQQLEVSEFSHQIKLLARGLEVPMIMLSQFSRNAEQRKNGAPQFADLREPGPLEQDVDVMIMLRRPEFYTQNLAGGERGQAALHTLRYRDGQLDKIDTLFQGHYSRFTDQPVTTFDPI